MINQRHIYITDTSSHISNLYLSYLNGNRILLEFQHEGQERKIHSISTYDFDNLLMTETLVNTCNKRTSTFSYDNDRLLTEKKVTYNIEGISYKDYKVKYNYNKDSLLDNFICKNGQLNNKVVVNHHYNQDAKLIRKEFKFRYYPEFHLYSQPGQLKRNDLVIQKFTYNEMNLISIIEEYSNSILVTKIEYEYFQ